MRVETQVCVSSMVLGNVIIIFYNSNPVKELSSYFIGENRFAVINHLTSISQLCGTKLGSPIPKLKFYHIMILL